MNNFYTISRSLIGLELFGGKNIIILISHKYFSKMFRSNFYNLFKNTHEHEIKMHSRLCETSELLIKENTNAMHCVAKLSKTSKIKLKFDKCHNSEKDGLISSANLVCRICHATHVCTLTWEIWRSKSLS